MELLVRLWTSAGAWLPSMVCADKFASYAGQLEAHLHEQGTLTCQPIMWQAWGRVPA